MEYVLLIRRAEDGGFRAEVPALKGCFVEAATLDGLLAAAPKAISSHLEALRESGRQVPTDSGIIIATVTALGSPASSNEEQSARVLLRGVREQYPVRSGGEVPAQGDMSARPDRVERELSPEVTIPLPERLAESARVFAVVFILWALAVGGWVLWNAWDARDGTAAARGTGTPAAAAAQTAPTPAPSATAVQPTAQSVASPATPAPALSPTPRIARNGYLVEPGETLWDISQRFGVTVEEIMQANNLTDRSFVMAGQRLAIPEPRR